MADDLLDGLAWCRARGWRNRMAAEGDPVPGRVVFTAPLPLPPVVVTAVVETDEYGRARVDLVDLSVNHLSVNLAWLAREAHQDPEEVLARLHNYACLIHGQSAARAP